MWRWTQLAAPTQRWTHGPEGQRSLRGLATGAPHSAEREKCGEEEAGHREGGMGDRWRKMERCPRCWGLGWSPGPVTGKDAHVRSEEGKVLGLEPDPHSPHHHPPRQPTAGAGTRRCQQRAEYARSVREPCARLCAARPPAPPGSGRPRPKRPEKADTAQAPEPKVWGFLFQGPRIKGV